MFEIGRSLREARERRRASYSQVEQDTKIRSRYIRALEDEEFSVLPGPTYTKGFLRAYAEYLGLDGQLFIDEFNSRHYDPRGDVEREIYPRSQGRTSRRHRKESNIVMIALAAIVAVSALVILGFQSSGGTNADYPVLPPKGVSGSSSPDGGSPSSTATSTSGQQTGTANSKTTKKTAPAKFVVTIAVSGDCWVTAHVGSPAGPGAVTTKGTDLSSWELLAGQTATVRTARPVFISFGAPSSVDRVAVNGKAVQLPYLSSGSIVKITRAGVTKV
jgi:cytoskeletal protein RodZ